jgi:hypothetical protein
MPAPGASILLPSPRFPSRASEPHQNPSTPALTSRLPRVAAAIATRWPSPIRLSPSSPYKNPHFSTLCPFTPLHHPTPRCQTRYGAARAAARATDAEALLLVVTAW